LFVSKGSQEGSAVLFPQKKVTKENSRLRSDPTLVCALAGTVVAESALMPMGNGDVRFVLLFF